ncbi:spermidine synthase [Phenylobacterium sp.]|uniref:spermine/spermidine synthase domain-containing protein n=1 Tax=Phenylobacterium sp. TaxID=1871053 RepID=UPI00272F557D|nr:spermidine synthase [Phenylobacterium sp.]MDP1872563.1 spermidine synthase [Phenylobacterium sp.]
MKPWIHLDSAQMPDGGGELRLMRRDTEFSIMAGSIELMNSRLSGSEEALATLAWARLAGREGPRVLIGGLGMGFTLRAALAVLPADAKVTVAELVPEVIAWARGPLAEVFRGCLDDPRVAVHQGDVGPLIAAAPAAWDAILLDVDNGPEGLTRKANDSLYDLPGLARAQTSLRPGGVLAVWSSAPDEGFTRRMRRTGLKTEEVRVPARKNGRGARHVIWLGVRG